MPLLQQTAHTSLLIPNSPPQAPQLQKKASQLSVKAEKTNTKLTATENKKMTDVSVKPLALYLQEAKDNKIASTDEIIQAIKDEFPDAPIMLAVARAESGLDPLIKNPTSSASGLFQITAQTFSDCDGDVFDVEDNIKCARMLYDTRGLQPWEASKWMWSISANFAMPISFIKYKATLSVGFHQPWQLLRNPY